jgi:hypothetical protein
MLPDPENVGLQRLSKLVSGNIETRRIVEENEVESL